MAWLEQLRGERRAIELRVGGEQRWVAAEDAGLYRDALGAVPPSGLPEAFIADVPGRDGAARASATRAPTARSRAARCATATASTSRPCWSGSSSPATLVRGELRPGGTPREWCDPEVLRRLRRASLAALRAEIEPADQRALARFLANWQGVDRHPPAGAGIDRLREMLVPLQGLPLPLEVWERDVLPRRTGAYSPRGWTSCARRGEVVWVGAGALGRRSGRVALYFRDDAPLHRPAADARRVARRAGARGDPRAPAGRRRASSPTCSTDIAGFPTEELQNGALGPRVGGRGDQRRVRAAALPEARSLDAAVVAAGAGGTPAHVRLAPARRRAARRPGPLVA